MKAGIYLHIPFCKSRCSYCDFATDVWRSDAAVERYVIALAHEISRFQSSDDRSEIRNRNHEIEVDTVYFGGGTPSLLSPKQLERILDRIRRRFAVADEAEITLEMNPGTVSLERLKEYKALGINRASFGVQTFDDRALKLLARGHNSDDARRTFELLRQAGFENISFDLIAGLPHQTLNDWERNLNQAIELSPEHISLYLLEVHEGTPLAEQIRSRRQPLPDEDLSGEMYELMLDKVAANGYIQYEISNFSKPGFESRHNSKYWQFEPVFAFGVSAHSFDGYNKRRANVRDTNMYVSLIEKGESPVAETVELSPEQRSGEFAFLSLRRTKGLNMLEFAEQFGFDVREKFSEDLARVFDFGLIEISGNHLRLTRKGMVFSNEVFALFV